MKYDTPNQHLRKLQVEQVITYIKTLAFVFLGSLALWVLIAIKPDFTFNDRWNDCLKTHDLDYCNKEVK